MSTPKLPKPGVKPKPPRSGSVSNDQVCCTSPTVVPKLPPRTYKTLERERKRSVAEQEDRPHFIPIGSEEFTPEALVREMVLPQMVVVCQGYDGASSEYSVSTGDEFIVHLVKSMQVIPAKLSEGTTSDQIHIPVNSPLSIGIIRHDNSKIYPSVKDLLKLPDIPRVVEVRRKFVSKRDNNFIVDITSVLYIIGQSGKTILHCKHESGKILTLTADLVGDFSTDPMEAVIPIAEYTMLMKVYPVTVRLLQRGVDVDDNTIAQYIGQTFVLGAPIEKRSLIATTDVNGTRVENPAIVEIPMELPLLFKCIERMDVDMEHAYGFSIELYSTFDPSKIDVTYDSTPVVGEGNYYTQIYDSPDQIQDNVYVTFDIICPNPRTEALKRALQSHPTKSQVSLSPGQSNSPPGQIYSPPSQINSPPSQINSPPKVPNQRRSSTMPRLQRKTMGHSIDNAIFEYDKRSDHFVQDLAIENDRVVQLNSKIETLLDERNTLKKQLFYSEKKCSDLESELVRVNKTASRLRSQLEKLTNASRIVPVTHSPEENKERLSKMNVSDISNLLVQMKYEMYKPNFSDELVDGQLLVTLEEDDLKELGVNSCVHRRRFINLIQGRESVDKYFCKY